MRKFLLLLFMSIAVNFVFADHIETGPATKIAKNFYLQAVKNKGLSDVTLTLAYTEKSASVSMFRNSDPQETPVFYIFNVNQNDGFVIVSADNDVTPVLGYTITGSYTGTNLPPAFQKLLEKYKKEILYVVINNLKADNEIETRWENLENGKPLNPSKDAKSVSPLLHTTWAQFPYENEMCPEDAAGP